MDLDSDDRIIAQGDYRRALNFLNAKNNKDSLGAGEKSLGTREVHSHFHWEATKSLARIGKKPSTKYSILFTTTIILTGYISTM